MTDKSSLRETWASPSLPALTRRCRRPKTCATGCRADIRAFPWTCSALVANPGTEKTLFLSTHYLPCLHCSSALVLLPRQRGGTQESRCPEPQICTHLSHRQQEVIQEKHLVPEISRQFSSSNLQASVRVRKRQPMGFRGWPTQPSRLVMVVAPRCSSSE